MKLPPLPKGHSAAEWGGPDTKPYLYWDEEVIAYGDARAAAAQAAERERCERWAFLEDDDGFLLDRIRSGAPAPE